MIDDGSPFPQVAAKDLDGGDTTVNALAEGSWTTVLFYRGHW